MEEQDQQWKGPLNPYANNYNQQNSVKANSAKSQNSRNDQDFLDLDHERYENRINQNDNIAVGQLNPDIQPESDKQNCQVSFADLDNYLISKQISLSTLRKVCKTILDYFDNFHIDQLKRYIRLIMQCSWNTSQQQQLRQKQMSLAFQIIIFLKHVIVKSMKKSSNLSVFWQIFNTKAVFYKLNITISVFFEDNLQYFGSCQADVFQIKKIFNQFSQNITIILQKLSELNFGIILYSVLSQFCINNLNNSLKQKSKNAHIIKYISNSTWFDTLNLIKITNHLIELSTSQIKKQTKSQFQDYCKTILGFAIGNTVYIQSYVFPIIDELILQESSMDRKSQAIKMISQLVQSQKVFPQTANCLLLYIKKKNIFAKFVNDRTHHQILKRFPSILRFLYDHNQIKTCQILNLVDESLNGHQQFFKIIQGIVHYLKLSDLQEVFNILKQKNCFEHPHVAGYFYQITNNFHLSPNNLNRKKKKNTSKKIKIQSNQKILQQVENQRQLNNMQFQSGQNVFFHKVIQNLFHLLMSLLEKYQNIYIPILCKLISNQIQVILPFLRLQLLNLLKKYHPSSLWILQHCLKIQIDKDVQENNSNAKKNIFVIDLLAEGLYDYIYIILTKNRFNKLTVQKTINVIILLCRSYRPLQKSNVQILWKILAQNSKDQLEREQFFQFIKQILKFKNTLTEEAAKHIYFQLFLKFYYDWFSIKIYDCFQMLFMRLNEDWNLLSYQNGTYHVKNVQFIGIQKFYYLYFWADTKVSKKIKDFLFKLTIYCSQSVIKEQLFKQYIKWVMAYLKKDEDSLTKNLRAKSQADYKLHVNRAFQFFFKMIQMPKLNGQELNEQNSISLSIANATKQAAPPLKKTIQVSKNMKLKDFRQMVRQVINPPLKEIKLVAKGNTLKLDNLTLKQLKIQNKNTILVQNVDVIPEQIVNSIPVERKQDQIKGMFFSIFCQEYSVQFLQFVLQKYQGQGLQRMCQIAVDASRMSQLKIQFDQLQALEKEKDHSISNNLIQQEQQLTPKKFDQLLSAQIPLLLLIINNQANSTHSKHWNLIRKVPANRQIWIYVQSQIQNIQPRWDHIFNHRSQSISFQIYSLFILNKILEVKKQTHNSQYTQFLKSIFGARKLKMYLLKVLDQLFKDKSYHLQLYTEIFSLLGFNLPKTQFVLQCHLNQSIALQLFTLIHNVESQLQLFQLKQDLNIFLSNFLNILQILQQNYVQKSLCCTILCYSLLSLIYCKKQQNKIRIEELNITENFKYSKIVKLCCKYGEQFTVFYLSYLLTCCQAQYNQSLLKEVYHNLKQLIIVRNQTYFIQQGDSSNKNTSNNSMCAIHSFAKSVNKIQWFFILLVGLIQIAQIQAQQQFQVSLINKFITQFKSMWTNQISGYLYLLNHLIRSTHIKNQNKISVNEQITRKANKLMDQLGKWLFSEFVFGSNQLILNEPMIKLNYFALATTISQVDRPKFHLICKDVINFGTQRRNIQNDHIDFRTKQFIGIKNLGSTCYINSLTQQLYHTKFSQLLLQSQGANDNLNQLKNVFAQLYSTVKDVINIKPMINQVKFYGQAIVPTVQQDAQQFLMSLCSYIELCGQKHLLDQVFGGSYCQQLTYFQDGQTFKKYKTQQFYNITLDIKGKKNLNEALTYFSRYQILDQKIQCQELNKKMNVGKKTFIQSFPNILIITLKRFQYDVESQTRNKLNDSLEFPIQLNLNQLSAKNIEKKQKQEIHEFQYNKYKLCGVLIHSGSAQSGHYYSYIKVRQKWYQFNDKHVTEINQTQKFRTECFGSSQNKSKSAYILFYQKQNKSKEDLYHGVRLNKIQKKNLYLQKVQQDNKKFIKERFVFDSQYRNFLDYLINRIKLNIIQKKGNQFQDYQKQEKSILQKLNDIKQLINPKNKVYFESLEEKCKNFQPSEVIMSETYKKTSGSKGIQIIGNNIFVQDKENQWPNVQPLNNAQNEFDI